jgi:para-aminobenzoate synthetase component 1
MSTAQATSESPWSARSTPASFAGAIEEIATVPDIERTLAAAARLPHCIFLDSARQQDDLGRYSFLAADPFDFVSLGIDEALTAASTNESVFKSLETRVQSFAAQTVAGLPPFQGGLAGLFGYDLNRTIERIAPPRYDGFALPVLAVGLYDVVLAIDQVEQKAWIISQGWPEREPARRRQRARERLQRFQAVVLQGGTDKPAAGLSVGVGKAVLPWPAVPRGAAVPPGRIAPQSMVLAGTDLTSNFSRREYIETIERAIEYIHAGDVFQVNLAQRLLHPARDDSLSLYLRMRRRNPAPFAAYFDLGEFQIISASPERFLKVEDGHVEARPIKGTRRRSTWPEADLFAGDELLQSEKDRAENVMIVDLLRNDLARVCTPDSVATSDLCRLEVYEFVQHLVSVVRGKLRPECSPFDLLGAAFPGGSITGAPKVRAMEIIAELEPTARGPYCGSLGYIGFDGAMDTNILIRTITAGRGWWQFPVGGGIVAQSDPEREYEETWHKAEGLLRAL